MTEFVICYGNSLKNFKFNIIIIKIILHNKHIIVVIYIYIRIIFKLPTAVYYTICMIRYYYLT